MKIDKIISGCPEKNKSWGELLSKTYFPLDVQCRNEPEFNGTLKSCSLGLVDLSLMECDGVLYRRHKHHFLNEHDSSLLITIPLENDINFQQSSRETRCKPGEFLVERGDAPYEFWHGKRNKLWVLKVPTASVRSRIGSTDRLGALSFDATVGVASYFIGAVRNAIEFADNINETARDTAGQHLLDMLCLSIRSDDRILDSSQSTIRAAHLQRAEQFIRDNLLNPKLNSQLVAESCGISLRYLQRLFAENNYSIVGYIRDKRLTRCDEELKMFDDKLSVASIAYKWGFYDQAQFSKHYRNRFGCTPTQTRKQNRLQMIKNE